MKKLIYVLIIGSFLTGCVFMKNLFLETKSEMNNIDISKKNPNNKRVFKEVKLSNKLRVLLISDPNLNKSAAAMDVQVGSLSDPTEHQGMSHFLEHMLFMGTKKYPEVDEYNKFVEKHQGYNNAYTSSEHTNYFFEINNNAFEDALDRFSRFFFEPSFDEKYIERELNAVNSEHQKNLLNDDWREMQVIKSLHKKGHPLTKFSTGDKNTLKSLTRNELITYYKEHYSADNMTLTLLSPYPIDKLEPIAKKMFSQIPSNNLKKQSIDSELFSKKDLPRLIKIKPIKEKHTLEFIFEIPSQINSWQTKSTSILAHLIGHEGEGSLLSYLKKEDLALKLSAGSHSYVFKGSFNVTIQLTPKGYNNWEQVAEAYFSYVDLLKKQDLDQFIFDEMKMMSELNHYYKDHQEGGYYTSHYAAKMRFHPGEEIDKRLDIYYKFNREDYNNILSYISVDNLNLILVDQKNNTDQKEKYYQTDYSTKKLRDSLQKRLNNPTMIASLHLPKKNPFIPENHEVLSSKEPTKPIKIMDNEFGTFWYQQDDVFNLPKGSLRLDIITKQVNSSPHKKVMSILYDRAIEEALNEWLYTAELADLHQNISREDRGITIEISGYSEKIPYLLEELATRLKYITINEETFNTIKMNFVRTLNNFSLEEAYRQAFTEINIINNKSKIHFKEYYDPNNNIDLISKVSLQDLKSYTKDLFKEIGLEGAAYGSIPETVLREALLKIPTVLKSTPLSKDQFPKEEIISLEKKRNYYLLRENKTNNNAFMQNIYFGKFSYSTKALIKVITAKLESEFFTSLRSNQQLGYIVNASPVFNNKYLAIRFVIQSEYSPIEISKKVKTWRESFVNSLTEIDDEKLNEYKNAVIKELEETDKTISERQQTLYFEAITMEEDFGHKKKLIDSVKKIDKTTLVNTLKSALDIQRRSVSVLMFKNNSKIEKPKDGIVIDDVKSFKDSVSNY